MWLISGGMLTKQVKRSPSNYMSKLRDGLLWVSVQVCISLSSNQSLCIARSSQLAGGMKGADIGLGWIDAKGQLRFQVRTTLFSMELDGGFSIGSLCLQLHKTRDG